MKRTIRLTESELTKMITECVKSSIRSNKKKALKDSSYARRLPFVYNLYKDRMSPENYEAFYDLGHVYFELGDYESAISNFETVITYQENNELLYYALAQAYEANNEIDKAISNYLKAIAVNDKFTLAYKKVGVLFLARNDYEDAIEYFEDYLNFDIPQEEKESVEKLVERIKAKL